MRDEVLEAYIKELQRRQEFREALLLKLQSDPKAVQELYEDWQAVFDWLDTRA